MKREAGKAGLTIVPSRAREQAELTLTISTVVGKETSPTAYEQGTLGESPSSWSRLCLIYSEAAFVWALMCS